MHEYLRQRREVERSEWDVFSAENQEKLKKLQDKDPKGFELVKEYFDIRRTEMNLTKEESRKTLLEFGNKVDEEVGDDEVREEKLAVFFHEITDKYTSKHEE